jgi:hypothetical protein
MRGLDFSVFHISYRLEIKKRRARGGDQQTLQHKGKKIKTSSKMK